MYVLLIMQHSNILLNSDFEINSKEISGGGFNAWHPASDHTNRNLLCFWSPGERLQFKSEYRVEMEVQFFIHIGYYLVFVAFFVELLKKL